MKAYLYGIAVVAALTATACKKKGCTDPTATNYSESAKKDDGSCKYDFSYTVPTTYVFTDNSGNSTVDYSGQEARIEQMKQMLAYIKTGRTSVISAQNIRDMFQNTGGNGAGQFTGIAANATKQLKDKCFAPDVALIESYFDSVALASVDYATTAAEGQAGTLTSGTSVYLFNASGMEYGEVIEKTLMGALLEYQALNVYFGEAKMTADNTTAVDPANGVYYTQLAHHWDEAFGYFGVPTDFPATPATSFWGKYCNSQNTNLGSNAVMMNTFLKGRAAIVNAAYTDRDEAIQAIRLMWEDIAANQAMTYLNNAIGYFGNDQAKFLHNLSEAYGFVRTLRYAPDATRRMTITEVDGLTAEFGTNFWALSVQDLQDIKAALDAKY
jgi:hypothetical protein